MHYRPKMYEMYVNLKNELQNVLSYARALDRFARNLNGCCSIGFARKDKRQPTCYEVGK